MNQIENDIKFVKSILPLHYRVQESKKIGSIHCVSQIGIVKNSYVNSKGKLITDDEDEKHWNFIFSAFKQYFGLRFQEVDHNTCYCHADFTLYLKNENNYYCK